MLKDIASTLEALGDALGPCQTEAVRARQADELTAPLQEEIDVLKLDLAERDAMLHEVLTTLHLIDSVFYEGYSAEVVPCLKKHLNAAPAGVTWDLIESWWADHKAKRRAREEQHAKERELRRQEILNRLTAEEREILGIK